MKVELKQLTKELRELEEKTQIHLTAILERLRKDGYKDSINGQNIQTDKFVYEIIGITKDNKLNVVDIEDPNGEDFILASDELDLDEMFGLLLFIKVQVLKQKD